MVKTRTGNQRNLKKQRNEEKIFRKWGEENRICTLGNKGIGEIFTEICKSWNNEQNEIGKMTYLETDGKEWKRMRFNFQEYTIKIKLENQKFGEKRKELGKCSNNYECEWKNIDTRFFKAQS
jgi:hypothetical protein